MKVDYLGKVVIQVGGFTRLKLTQLTGKDGVLHPDVVHIEMTVSIALLFKLSVTYVTLVQQSGART